MTEVMRTGGCQCGAVRFEVMGAPRRIGACHCRMCQRAVGAPFGIYAVFAPKQVTWTQTPPRLFRSSNVAARGFCADCGTPMTYHPADGGSLDILSTVFDDPSDLAPTYAIGIESKLPWTDHLPTLPGKTTAENLGQSAAQIVSRQRGLQNLGRRPKPLF